MLAILSLVALTSACATDGTVKEIDQNTTWDACYPSFKRHVDTIAGLDAKDCGFWRLGQSKASLAEVTACAKTAASGSEAFKLGHSDMGYDSYFCDVAIRDSSGQLWSFFYDSDVSGGSGGAATIWVSECKSFALEKGTIGKHSFFNLDECDLDDDLKARLIADQ